MVIDLLREFIFNIENFHRFTYYLGTPSGELLKRFIELVFYGIIIYMILSEYRQNKKRDLIKFLEYKRIDSHIIITIC